MINEKGNRIFRKLIYYFENKIEVHINSTVGFRNGLILDLSESKLSLVIDDHKNGATPILLEDINEESISKYREKF